VPFKFSQTHVEPTLQLLTCLEPNSGLQFFICLSVLSSLQHIISKQSRVKEQRCMKLQVYMQLADGGAVQSTWRLFVRGKLKTCIAPQQLAEAPWKTPSTSQCIIEFKYVSWFRRTNTRTRHPYYGLISRTTCGHAWYKFMRTLSLKVC